MSKFLNVALIICVGMCTAIVCASAQSARQDANDKPAVAVTTVKSAATTPTIDELSGLLPASDFIAVIDAGRAFNDLLPRLADLHIDDVDAMIKEIREFSVKTGIDLSKAKNAALGFRVYGKQLIGAAIISGLDGDEGLIEAVMHAYEAKYRTADYKGKAIYITSAGGPWSFSDSQTAIASLGRQKFVLGDLSAVKSVIDIHSGEAKGAMSPAMIAALKETRESAIVRFTLNFLESWRQEILKQDGFLKSLAAIKMIFGALDTADDLSMSLGAIFRTASQNEASDLESGLKALVSLIGGYLSGDPKLKGFGPLLDLVKIGSQQNDVSLAITAPLSSLRSVTGQATGGSGSGTGNSASTSPVFGFDARFTSGKSAIAIPFELDDYNHIWLRVIVNGSPLSFLLDTGGSGPYPMLSVRAAESLGMKLQFLGRKTNVGVGTKPTDFHLVTDKSSLSLPGVEMSSRSLFVMSTNDCADQATDGGIDRNVPSKQNLKEGTKKVMDGGFGNGFFSSFVVEIDYPARLINLYDPQSYKYTGAGKSFPLEMDDLIYAQAQVKAPGLPPVTARLAVDTGAATTLTLNRRFAEEHKLLPPPEKLTATNECGVGGMAEGTSYEGRLEALQLGDIMWSNPLTFFRKNPVGEGYDGLLGGGALRHFKVIFDYSRRRMILEPPSPLIPASPIKIEQQQSSSQRADAVTAPDAVSTATSPTKQNEQQLEKSSRAMPTVDQILDRYVQATGGDAAHRKLTSRITTGTIEIENSHITVSYERYQQGPNRQVEISWFNYGNGMKFQVSHGFNGAVGWMLNPTDGGFRELSGTELASEKRDAEFYWGIKLKELYPKMTLIGPVQVGAQTAYYCIEATPPEGDSVKLYFGAQTGLLTRVDSTFESVQEGKVPYTTYFEDYREVDGIKLPFVLRQPQWKYKYKFKELRHNVPVEEEKFKSPGAAIDELSVSRVKRSGHPSASRGVLYLSLQSTNNRVSIRAELDEKSKSFTLAKGAEEIVSRLKMVFEKIDERKATKAELTPVLEEFGGLIFTPIADLVNSSTEIQFVIPGRFLTFPLDLLHFKGRPLFLQKPVTYSFDKTGSGQFSLSPQRTALIISDPSTDPENGCQVLKDILPSSRYYKIDEMDLSRLSSQQAADILLISAHGGVQFVNTDAMKMGEERLGPQHLTHLSPSMVYLDSCNLGVSAHFIQSFRDRGTQFYVAPILSNEAGDSSTKTIAYFFERLKAGDTPSQAMFYTRKKLYEFYGEKEGFNKLLFRAFPFRVYALN